MFGRGRGPEGVGERGFWEEIKEGGMEKRWGTYDGKTVTGETNDGLGVCIWVCEGDEDVAVDGVKAFVLEGGV